MRISELIKIVKQLSTKPAFLPDYANVTVTGRDASDLDEFGFLTETRTPATSGWVLVVCTLSIGSGSDGTKIAAVTLMEDPNGLGWFVDAAIVAGKTVIQMLIPPGADYLIQYSMDAGLTGGLIIAEYPSL